MKIILRQCENPKGEVGVMVTVTPHPEGKLTREVQVYRDADGEEDYIATYNLQDDGTVLVHMAPHVGPVVMP